MRRTLLFIASALLAATASAQIGSPGVTNPVSLTSDSAATDLRTSGFLQIGAITTKTTSGVAVTHTGVGGHQFMVDGTSPNARSVFQLSSGLARLSVRDDVTSDESYLTLSKDGFTPSELFVSGADFTIAAQTTSGGQANITMNYQDSGTITFYATDQLSDAATMRLGDKGFSAANWQDTASAYGGGAGTVQYITGGYSVFGVVVGVDTTVAVTITDTTPSITDGDVQVCGLQNANWNSGIVTCDVLDFSGGAGTLTTVLGFRFVSHIKTTSFATLGGAGDEKISAAYTAGATLRTATDLVNHTASLILDGSGANPGHTPDTVNIYNYFTIKCLDLAGCSLNSMAAPSGVIGIGNSPLPVTIMIAPGSTPVTAADSATLKVSAAHTLDEHDTLSLVWSPNVTAWLQTSVSVN